MSAPISRDLVAASAAPLVLAILKRAPSYGYAILAQVRELSREELTWSEGMLYPVLHRLEAQGLIEAFEQLGDNGRLRKYYRLLPAGRRALVAERTQWMTVHATLARAFGD